ncbi:hypothetical protein D3C72_1384300 [compost metagenome]
MELEKKSDIPPDLLSSVTAFLSLLDPSQVVLVLGSESGEILERFKARGYRVVGLESDPELIQKSRERGLEVIEGSLNKIASLNLPRNIGGVWAGATFSHTTASDLEHILEVIHLMLPEKGGFYLAVPKGKGEVLDSSGKVTQFYSEDELRKILTDKYFEIIQLETSTPSLITAVVKR